MRQEGSTQMIPTTEALASAWTLFVDAARMIDGVRIATVAVAALPHLEKQVAKIAKRAAKHDIPVPTLVQLGDAFTVSRERRNGQMAHLECVRVRIDAPEYRVAGASFVAALHHTPAGTMTFAHPKHEDRDLSAYRHLDGKRCDHCRTQRRRKRSFVVDTAEGTQVVGATCLRDYFGIDVAAEVVWRGFDKIWAALLGEAVETFGDDEGLGGNGGRWQVDANDYLARAIFSVASHGYAKSSCDQSTRRDVEDLLNPSSKALAEDPEYAATVYQAGDRYHRAAAAFLRGWALEHITGTSDFDHNLRLAAANRGVLPQARGLLCYLPEAYRRARGKAAAEKARQAAPSAHLGGVGERIEREVVVESVKVTDGYYGARSIVRFRDTEGNVMMWFKAGYFEPAPGAQGKLRGTVKKHDEYRGVKQTVVQRCRWT